MSTPPGTTANAGGKSISTNQDSKPILAAPSTPLAEGAELYIAADGIATSLELNLDATISRLLQVGRSRRIPQPFCLEPAEISAICSAASNVLLAEPSLLEITAPVTIVGDIHGQYTDLLRVFDRCGFPDTTHYLFLGNYVSKGRNSLETILLLLCYKIKYPQTFFLLRGNHECASITRMSLFYSECKYRCKVNVWRTFRTVKSSFPIAATVSGKFFCVHGGLSPSLTSLDDIRAIARPTDVSDTGLLTDLLWSDPADVGEDWTENDRGVSYYFNKRVTRSFLQHTGLEIICRGHTAVDEGYKFDFDNTLVTIFSAPKHHDDLNNSGAVMNISADLSYSFETFEALDPYTRRREVLPGDQPSQPEGEAQGPLHGVPFAPDSSSSVSRGESTRVDSSATSNGGRRIEHTTGDTPTKDELRATHVSRNLV